MLEFKCLEWFFLGISLMIWLIDGINFIKSWFSYSVFWLFLYIRTHIVIQGFQSSCIRTQRLINAGSSINQIFNEIPRKNHSKHLNSNIITLLSTIDYQNNYRPSLQEKYRSHTHDINYLLHLIWQFICFHLSIQRNKKKIVLNSIYPPRLSCESINMNKSEQKLWMENENIRKRKCSTGTEFYMQIYVRCWVLQSLFCICNVFFCYI